MQERYSDVLTSIYIDVAGLCGVQPDQRDIRTISRRCHHEGRAFVEIALPRLAKDVEKCLERGYVETTDFMYFAKIRKCPRFLGVFFSLLFDDTGQLRPDAPAVAVGALRQFSMYKKIKEVCDNDKVDKAFKNYRAIEQEVSCNTAIPERWQHQFDAVSRHLWGSLRSFNSFETVPKHGPGAVQERVSGFDKYPLIRKRWYERLQNFFPYDSFALPSISSIDMLDECEFVSQEEESAVRVIAVPKTATKPRIIAIEPTCMQYCQQAVSIWTYAHLERENVFTSGHVNFRDQTINASLALESSQTRANATLDMSEASERVPLTHIKRMLQDVPDYLGAILACRTTKANLNGEIIELAKFASMGSALCFPIEAMYFYTLCVVALIGDKSPTFHAVKNACKRIYVYGDDIIVPTNRTPDVISVLVAFGNKVNTDKSFWKGYFRESCGQDAFKGEDVTPVYMRKHVPKSHRSPDWVSLVETANQCFDIGLWQTATTIDKIVESVIGAIPVTQRDSQGLHKTSFCGEPTDWGLPNRMRRYNHSLQRWQYRSHVVSMPKIRQRGLLVSDFLLASFHRMLSKQRVNSPLSYDSGLDGYNSTKSTGGICTRRGGGTLKSRWI